MGFNSAFKGLKHYKLREKLKISGKRITVFFKTKRKPQIFVFYGKIRLFFLVFMKVVPVVATELEFCEAQWHLHVELALTL